MALRPVNFPESGDTVDPLVEQMRSVMDLISPPAAAAADRRSRRLSYSDPPVTAGPSTQTDNAAVRSRDGTKWLPLPFQRSRIFDRGSHASAVESEPDAISSSLDAHECTSADCAAIRTFATPELLELILRNLNIRDVLEIRRTSPVFNLTVDASPQLRLYHFMYPQWRRPSETFLLLPLNVPGLTISLGEPIHLGRYVTIKMTREGASRIHVPRPKLRARSRSIYEGLRGGLGPRATDSNNAWPNVQPPEPVRHDNVRYEDLYITQPPTVGLQAFVTTASDLNWGAPNLPPGSSFSACAKLHCDAGITLGFLAETALSLISEVTTDDSENVQVVYRVTVSYFPPESAPRKRLAARSVTKVK